MKKGMKSGGAGAKCDHFKLGVRTLIWTCEVRATQKTVATHTLRILHNCKKVGGYLLVRFICITSLYVV